MIILSVFAPVIPIVILTQINIEVFKNKFIFIYIIKNLKSQFCYKNV